MASFKLCISDPSSGKTFQREVKDNLARPFLGMNIGETISGDNFEFGGFEFQITGGSDYCGFPMRKGILGQRKKIAILGGVGFAGDSKGIKRRKTVCGHKIHDKISQINLKVTKQGARKLPEIFGVTGEDSKETKKEEAKEHKLEAKKEEAKEHKLEAKKEEAKEHKEHKQEQDKTLAKEEKHEHKVQSKEHKEEKKD